VPASIPEIDELVETLTRLARTQPDPTALATGVREALAQTLQRGVAVPKGYSQCETDCYQARQFHIDPEGAFSICIMAWRPGQTTAIHDHIAWCVVGVCEGREVEELFTLGHDEAGKPVLQPAGTNAMAPGQTAIHWPVENDIHRVTCGDAPAVSIHIYGTDISVPGTSIRTTFDRLSVVERPVGLPTR
jgi:predicted metal-dependent enzyme (double-stranded beta helix superfamily)